jgi:hypothetical protein
VSISFTDGDEPQARIGDADVNFQATRDPDGKLTTVSDAPFGLAPTFTLGSSTGSSSLFGESFDANHGEAAQLEWSGLRRRRRRMPEPKVTADRSAAGEAIAPTRLMGPANLSRAVQVGLLVALAILAWIITADRMHGALREQPRRS